MGLNSALVSTQRAIAHLGTPLSNQLAPRHCHKFLAPLGLSLGLAALGVPALSQTLDGVFLDDTAQQTGFAAEPTALSPELDGFSVDQMAQVTAVSQLADVSPGDWAYEALAYLANDEAQGGLDCLEGYPSGLYLGGQAMTRYEFAAGLASCLDAVTGRLEQLDPEAIARIEALQREFAAELATLGDRLDELEAAASELEANQFSTTLRFNTLASFNFSQSFAGGDILAEGITVSGVSPASRRPARQFDLQTGQFGDPVVETVRDDPSTTFSYSTYFVFTGSFQQTDELTMILAMGNGDPPASTFSSAGFTSSFGIPYADSNPVTPLSPNSVGLFELKYAFPLFSEDFRLVVGPRILPFRHFDQNPFTNIVFGSSGLNFYQSTLAGNGLSGAGGLFEWTLSPQWLLRAGYLARNDRSQRIFDDPFISPGGDGPANPSRGFFNGNNNILAELTYSPSFNANIRLLYNRSRLEAPPPFPGVPEGLAVFPFLLTSLRGAVDDGFGGTVDDIIAHNFVLNFDWALSPGFAVFGRYSFSTSEIDPINPLRDGGNVEVQAFQLGFAFPDLGKPGALGTLAATIPFDVTDGEEFLVGGYGDGGTQVDVLASYYFPLNDNVGLVPMFFVSFNPNNFSENPPVYSIILRTQFLF